MPLTTHHTITAWRDEAVSDMPGSIATASDGGLIWVVQFLG
jgi:hypothetical protein